MRGNDLFGLYRQLLVIVVGTYTVVRMVNFVWHWQLATRSAGRAEAIARRYLVVQVLRLRIRRFVLDLLEVGVLLVVLGYLLWLHWQRALVF
jgi:hypothetical protein